MTGGGAVRATRGLSGAIGGVMGRAGSCGRELSAAARAPQGAVRARGGAADAARPGRPRGEAALAGGGGRGDDAGGGRATSASTGQGRSGDTRRRSEPARSRAVMTICTRHRRRGWIEQGHCHGRHRQTGARAFRMAAHRRGRRGGPRRGGHALRRRRQAHRRRPAVRDRRRPHLRRDGQGAGGRQHRVADRPGLRRERGLRRRRAGGEGLLQAAQRQHDHGAGADRPRRCCRR